MKDINPFQLILLTVFGFVGVVAVLVFAGLFDKSSSGGSGGEVLLWGSLPTEKISTVLGQFNEEHKDSFSIKYIFIKPENFEEKLIDGIASGKGPDVILLPDSLMYRQLNKILAIPYENYSERGFRDRFIDGAEIFLNKSGVVAVPLYVNPIVMYWNKDLFNFASVAKTPKLWTELVEIVPKMTIADKNANVSKSAVSLGTANNISYVKEILSTLIMQAGGEIVGMSDDSGKEFVKSLLGDYLLQAASVLKFYAQFSDPSKDVYSWNSALPQSLKAFESGLLAIYFGYASDFENIKRVNPHLNFDVAIMPQRDSASKKTTFGQFYGLAVLKSAKNPTAAFAVVYALDDDKVGKNISEAIKLPTPVRDILSKKTKDATLSVFNDSAIIARSFIDPSPKKTEEIFRSMISSTISGKETADRAVSNANIQMEALLSENNER